MKYIRHCDYCLNAFTATGWNQTNCSPHCAKRSAAWNRWIRDSRKSAIYGDVAKVAKIPKLSAAGIPEAVSLFALPATTRKAKAS